MRLKRAVAGLICLTLLMTGCTANSANPRSATSSTRGTSPATDATSTDPASTTSATAPAPISSPTASHTSRPIRMTAWHGPVEELFVHPLVINPKLAFTSDQLGIGFQDNFVTALEFRRILDELWAKGWTLVDVHRAANGTVRVPVGRRPLVFSEDDVNYYKYFDGRGLAKRLVLAGGRVRAELPDGTLSNDDVIPLVDAEVARHPEFSAAGAKGVIAVTGYEGLLGEHHPAEATARARLIAMAKWLKADGWTFASHTWGHINLTTSSLTTIAGDTKQWKAEADSILGPIDVLVYPFGARPDDAGIGQLARAGYRIQLDIDIVARTSHIAGAIVMSRRHVDGYAFGAPARQKPFYDVASVRDPARPPSGG